MLRVRSIGAFLLSFAALGPFGPSFVASAADAVHPTVIELFQSQGCSSCPPANANLQALAGRADVLALSFAVTYWDDLGWKDTFAQPAFTERQWDYSKAGGRLNVSTPQMIVNGLGVLVGHRKEQVEAALQHYDRGAGGPTITPHDGQVMVGAAPAREAAIVWLVRYDPRLQEVSVRAGENRGRTLPHRNVVRSLQSLGKWQGAPMSFAVPPLPDIAYQSAVLVQQGRGGPIIAARRI